MRALGSPLWRAARALGSPLWRAARALGSPLWRAARALALVVVLAVAAACGGGDGDEQASAQSCAGPSKAPVEGFGQVGFRVEGGDRHCALLAETSDQMSQGLMNQTDLGPYEGMVFRFGQDSLGGFYMLDTPMPLSIAWFRADGTFVSSADMEPCLDRSPCPTYPPAGPYRCALEVPQGNLDKLGIGPGARVEVDGGCG